MTSTLPNLRVGLCGLGAMGRGIARTLIRAGYSVAGYDIVAQLVENFRQDGGISASSPKEAATGADVLLIIVVNAVQVSSVLFDGESGAALGLPKDAAIIISSTVPGTFCREVRRRLDNDFGRSDVHLLDCPVSGGVSGAAQGTLTVFACGSDEGMTRAEPVLHTIGKKICRIRDGASANGKTGSGADGKVCHQVMPEIEIALVAEVVALAARVGLNSQEVYDYLHSGDAASWILRSRIPHALNGDDTVYSAMINSQKDSSIVVRTAGELSYPVPLVAAAEQVYQTTVHIGWAGMDDSALWRLYLIGKPDDTVHQLTKAKTGAEDSPITLQDLADIMIGVHIAATAESRGFTRAINLDMEQMYDIVCGAAGWNAQFEKVAPKMVKGPWYLQEIDGVREIGSKLALAVRKANSVGASMPIAAAAVQMFELQVGPL